MKPNQFSGNRFDSLNFLPDTCRENVPFYPMINNRRGLTRKLIRFVSHLLQPISDRITYSMTFNTAADVIDTMENYTKKGFLRSNTFFATLHIYDLSTIIVHKQMIEYLQRFLHEYVTDGRLQGISIQNILDLIRFILENQYILYEHKLYQQIRGSYLNSSLTKMKSLADVLIEYFLTWNESEDNLRTLLNVMNTQYPDMQTQVVHDLNIEPYALPYVFGHQ